MTWKEIKAQDWFLANLAGACESLAMLHWVVVIPVGLCVHKLAGVAALFGGMFWLWKGIKLREKLTQIKTMRGIWQSVQTKSNEAQKRNKVSEEKGE